MPRHRARWALLLGILVMALLLTGCDLPWPLNKLGHQAAPTQAQSRPYVASLIVRNLVQQNGLVLAVEPQASTFLATDVNLIILNKWNGLSVGEHSEAAAVLAPDGTELHREEATFTMTADDLTATLMEPFQLGPLDPGRYTAVIYLDGEEQVRYHFDVIPDPAS